MSNVLASREARLVPFSWFYHSTMRDTAFAIESAQSKAGTNDYDHRVSTVIILAACVTEAAINEIAYWLEKHLITPIPRSPKFDHLPIRKKWLVTPVQCGAAGFDESASLWKDFDALIDLRNALVHARAYPDPPSRALPVLDARGCTRPGSDWFESAMTPRTARWASETASMMPLTLKQMIAPHVDLNNRGFSWVWGSEWLPILAPP